MSSDSEEAKEAVKAALSEIEGTCSAEDAPELVLERLHKAGFEIVPLNRSIELPGQHSQESTTKRKVMAALAFLLFLGFLGLTMVFVIVGLEIIGLR